MTYIKFRIQGFLKSTLDFGFDSTSKSFTITNTGIGNLKYFLSTSQNWITVYPTTGEATTKTDNIKVTINRNGISEKKHIESIEIISEVGSNLLRDTIPVFVNGVIDQDMNYYNVVTISIQTWLAENLNVGKFTQVAAYVPNNGIIKKYCYNDDKNNCNIYGGLYRWDEMMKFNPQDSGLIGTTQGVCPDGWHIPTDKEWNTLVDYVGGVDIAGGKLKDTSSLWQAPNTGATNESGFSGLPGGFYLPEYGYGGFTRMGTNGAWWSSLGGGSGSFLLVSDESRLTYGTEIGIGAIDDGLSVRCIKDPPKNK